jgi:hypothetical protein
VSSDDHRAAATAARALAILAGGRDWPRDRDALGLPHGYISRKDEKAIIERRLGELGDAAVIDGWLVLVERDKAPHSTDVQTLVSVVVARQTSLAPFLARIDRALRRAYHLARDVLVEAGTLATAADPALIEVLRGILCDLDQLSNVAEATVRVAGAEVTVLVAGAWARLDPRAAGLVAARARIDRLRRRREFKARIPSAQMTTVSNLTLAEVVRTSRCAALASTAMFELERGSSLELWAPALLAIAGAEGMRYLTRMRGRPGWSALGGEAPEVPADPLEGLTSPLADVRWAALEALSEEPRIEHVQAFLLAAELDRFATRRIYRQRWFEHRNRLIGWMGLLRVLAEQPSLADELIDAAIHHRQPSSARFFGALGALIDGPALNQLLDANVARTVKLDRQELTPALRELAEQGVEAFAQKIVVRPLSDDERAALEAEEAELAALAGFGDIDQAALDDGRT